MRDIQKLAKRKTKKIKVNKEQARERIKKIWPILKRTYPHAAIALRFVNPLELLIATILSAQCTDKRVNMVTKDLFKKYTSAETDRIGHPNHGILPQQSP